MLRSQRKAAEEAEKANQISLEEFLEVEVRAPPSRESDALLTRTFTATQAGTKPHASHARVVREVEEDADGQEAGRGRGDEEGQGDAGRRGQEQRHERTGSGESHPQHDVCP